MGSNYTAEWRDNLHKYEALPDDSEPSELVRKWLTFFRHSVMMDTSVAIMGAPPEEKRSAMEWGYGGCLGFVVAFIGLAWAMLHFAPWNRFPESALEALRQDPAAIFYSLEPGIGDKPDGFHGYEIVGQIALDQAADRNAVVEKLAAATVGAWDEDAACFDPRHGLRAHSPDGTIDFLLCFECGKAYVCFPDGKVSGSG